MRPMSILKYMAIAVLPMTVGISATVLVMNHNKEAELAVYQQEIEVLQASLDEIGPMVDVYTVQSEVYPGKEITQEDLVPMQIPESVLTESYILDPASVVGKQYKIGVKAGTPIFLDFTMEQKIEDSTRDIDLVADSWPIGTRVGDYVDLTLTYPKGETFIVLSHKRVMDINGATLKIYLNEVEQHMYNAALVDYYLQKQAGATLNFTKYIEPGLQKEATVYYSIPANVEAVLLSDPNIVDAINTEVLEARRALIEGIIQSVDDESGSVINSGRAQTNASKSAASDEYKKKLESGEVVDAYTQGSDSYELEDGGAIDLADNTAEEETEETPQPEPPTPEEVQ